MKLTLHRLTLIGDISSCSRWELTKRFRNEQCAESETLEHSSLNGISLIKAFPSKSRNLCQRGGRKIVGAREVNYPKERLSFRHNEVVAHMNTLR